MTPSKTTSYRIKFVGGNGATLAGIVDRPAQEADIHAHRAVAVFSHCFTCNKDLKAIVRISRGLAAQGVAVLRYDMTGLGGSEGDFSQTSFTTNLADLDAAIEFADKEIGKVTGLIGHSFGGAASLAAAGGRGRSQAGGAIKAVVSLAAPSDTQHLAKLLSRMNPEIERDGVGNVSIGGRMWTIRRQMLEDFRTHDLPAAIARIACPTLLFHSPTDATVDYDHALRILGLIQSSPHATAGRPAPISLMTLRDSDHLLVDQTGDIPFVTDVTAAFLSRFAASG